MLKIASTISNIRTNVNPLRKVSTINRAVDNNIINKINLSNHLFVINFIQKIRKELVWDNTYNEFSHSVFLNNLLIFCQSLILFSTLVKTL